MAVEREQDPFSQAYNALWLMAEQSKRLCSMVRPGNRIKFNQQSHLPVDKEEIGEADLPELILIASQLNGKIRGTSSGSSALMQFQWVLSTGETALVTRCLPIVWAVYAAMVPWPQTALQILWREKPFIKRVDLLDATFGLTDAERNRGLRGWSSVWSCEVEMYFQSTDVIETNDL